LYLCGHVSPLAPTIVEENTRRKSVMVFCTVAAASTLTAATLFVPSRAQATPLAALSSLKTAIDHSSATQDVAYVCRRGSHGRRCYYVSRGYDRAYASGNGRYQSRREPSPYFDQPQWGGPYGEGSRRSLLRSPDAALRIRAALSSASLILRRAISVRAQRRSSRGVACAR
jgi:hypothetical protein